MIKSVKVLLGILACLIVTDGYAQKVFVGYGGQVVIDASAIRHTTTNKPQTTRATNTTRGWNDASDIASVENNRWVFHLFEVSKTELKATDWLTAVNGCVALQEKGSGWRLPTYKELILMLVLYPELRQFGINWNITSATIYWSATEASDTESFALYFNNPRMAALPKIPSVNPHLYSYRCIRELD
ncbi:hypothetical protein OXV64_20520 [Bacteroides fragilis]|uniref:hypothetical protein n=1 Tax=Bacteroides hominis TaxID=2763023 RepID=UPI00228C99E1|nr:hypothetical protein [Bacteroides fragilis]